MTMTMTTTNNKKSEYSLDFTKDDELEAIDIISRQARFNKLESLTKEVLNSEDIIKIMDDSYNSQAVYEALFLLECFGVYNSKDFKLLNGVQELLNKNKIETIKGNNSIMMIISPVQVRNILEHRKLVIDSLVHEVEPLVKPFEDILKEFHLITRELLTCGVVTLNKEWAKTISKHMLCFIKTANTIHHDRFNIIIL